MNILRLYGPGNAEEEVTDEGTDEKTNSDLLGDVITKIWQKSEHYKSEEDEEAGDKDRDGIEDIRVISYDRADIRDIILIL